MWDRLKSETFDNNSKTVQVQDRGIVCVKIGSHMCPLSYVVDDLGEP